MPKMLIVPDDIMTTLRDEQIPLSVLSSPEKLAAALSVHDMACICLAHEAFPFTFEASLDISLTQHPLTPLLDDSRWADKYRQVLERKSTLSLESKAYTGPFVPHYHLNPVDETLWVAVMRRHDWSEGDREKVLYRTNNVFFNALIMHLLHTQSFEDICRTSLFNHYLQSLVELPTSQ